MQQGFTDPCHLPSDGDGEYDSLDDMFLFILYRELSGPDYISLNSKIEKALGDRIKTGGDEKAKAIKELVNHCLKYLVWLSRRVIRDYGDRGDLALMRDLINAGYIAARCVAKNWDYKKGHFIPYAKECIEGTMRKYLTDTKSIVRTPRTKKRALEDKKEQYPNTQKLSFCSYEEVCSSLDLEKDEIGVDSSCEFTEKGNELIGVAETLVSMIETQDSCEVTHITT